MANKNRTQNAIWPTRLQEVVKHRSGLTETMADRLAEVAPAIWRICCASDNNNLETLRHITLTDVASWFGTADGSGTRKEF